MQAGNIASWKTAKDNLTLRRMPNGLYRLVYTNQKNTDDCWFGGAWKARNEDIAIAMVEQSEALKRRVLSKLKPMVGQQLTLF